MKNTTIIQTGGVNMKYIVNLNDKQPDKDPRSLRARVKDREKMVLRDTYYLIDQETALLSALLWA